MKLRSHILKAMPFLLLTASFSFLNQNVDNNNANEVVETQASTHVDNFASYAYSGNYYSSITASGEGLDGSLREQLSNKIVPSSYPTYSGSSGSTALAELLQYADEDPTNSENMIYFYTRDSVKKNAASSWNREHVWPQSLSGGNWGQVKAGADLLHIRPTYNTTNSTRSNNKYADLNKSGKALNYNGMAYGWSSGDKFEPLDSVKGDAARIVMYLYVAYQNVYSSTPNITNVFESYDTLLNWHINDAPDVLEGNRNDFAESSFQNNRNPFVDHPEYACKIFGTNASASVRQACFDKYGSEITYDDLESLSINKASLSLEVGQNENLSVTANPSTASSSVTWTSSNSSVATVSNNGLVKAIGKGNATITATSTVDTTISASCSITVTESETPIVSNSIKDCYSITSGTAVSDIYGIYVGSGDGNNPIIMNGEYGMLLYGVSIDSSWVKNETVLKVNGTLDIYKNLYELKNCSTTLVTDIDEIAQNVSSVVSYNITGNETTSNKDLANRLCLVSGTIVTASASNNDYKATMTLSNSKTVNLFVKSTYKSALENVIVAGASLTLKGFTSFYNNFQIQVFENVTVDDNYTATNFANDLMNKTNSICASSLNKKNELSPVWIDLEQNYYSKLSSTEKTILINSNASYKSGTAIEQAMDRYDYIVSHYLLNNFIAREINRTDFKFDLSISETSPIIAIIVSISALSLIAISSVSLIIKKKKTTK